MPGRVLGVLGVDPGGLEGSLGALGAVLGGPGGGARGPGGPGGVKRGPRGIKRLVTSTIWRPFSGARSRLVNGQNRVENRDLEKGVHANVWQ